MRDRSTPTQPNDPSDPGAGQPLSCAEIDGLLPAYAIGATDAAETALVRAHLRLCPTHGAELAKYGRLTQNLLLNVESVQPPARIGNQLRRMIDQPLTRIPPQPTATAEQQPRAWRWSAMWLAAAASAILLLGGFSAYALRQNFQLRQANRALTLQQAEQSAEQQQHAAVYGLITSAGMEFIDLPTVQPDSSASAEVMWNRQLDIALLYVESFPGLAPDQTYQLWLTYNGERQSGGVFTVDRNGNGSLIFALPQPLDGVELIGITPEPAGGSATPTADPVVRWRL